MDTLDAERLVARLEAATGGGPELDAEIEALCYGGVPASRCSDSTRRSYGPSAVFKRDDGSNIMLDDWHSAPAFTTLLDAALTLAPEGWGFKADCGLGHGNSFTVGHVGPDKLYDQSEGWGKGATPPIALCIAALRARFPAASLPETP